MELCRQMRREAICLPERLLFIDEIHRLSPVVEEYLYSAMEDYRIDYFIYGHRHIELDLNLPRIEGHTARMLILGDWITQFTYAVFDGEHLFLEEYVEGESRP